MLVSYSFDKDGQVKDQSSVTIVSPAMLKAIKARYKKVVAPQIKELKTALSNYYVSLHFASAQPLDIFISQ
ncbi:MAG: hypothetical protein ABF991_12350 [Liquorilactobacillus hordei]|uniref:hypothetical protein n=1 Tax=Liquorilactobacillus hordei TaxID=468911 RepID=UPI0039EBE112